MLAVDEAICMKGASEAVSATVKEPFGRCSWILAKSKCSLACTFALCWWTPICIMKHEITAPILRWKNEGCSAFISCAGTALRVWSVSLRCRAVCTKPSVNLCAASSVQALRTVSLHAHTPQHRDCSASHSTVAGQPHVCSGWEVWGCPEAPAAFWHAATQELIVLCHWICEL